MKWDFKALRLFRKKRTVIEPLNTTALSVAENAIGAKSEVLADMSPEIRIPLSGIFTTVDLLAQTELDASQRKYVEILRNSSELLFFVITEMLDLAKFEAGKVSLNLGAFDIRRESESLKRVFSAQAEAKGLRFDISVDKKVPQSVIVDPIRFHQVLSNLISNAVQYTEHGSITTWIGVIGHGSRRRLRVSVTDMGRGVSQKYQDIIFGKLNQVTRKEALSGASLGLSISKTLIEAMGGQIELVMSGDQGSTFWFDIPLTENFSNEKCDPAASVAALIEWYAKEPENVNEFIDLTLQDAEKLYQGIIQSVASGNVEAFIDNTHALKAVAGQIGGSRLASLCQKLEVAGKQGRMGEVGPDIETLAPTYKAFVDATKAVRL